MKESKTADVVHTQSHEPQPSDVLVLQMGETSPEVFSNNVNGPADITLVEGRDFRAFSQPYELLPRVSNDRPQLIVMGSLDHWQDTIRFVGQVRSRNPRAHVVYFSAVGIADRSLFDAYIEKDGLASFWKAGDAIRSFRIGQLCAIK